MTNTPTSWTDGYGTMHAGPPPAGYWIASDDRWYAPELHPDAIATTPSTSIADAPNSDVIDTIDNTPTSDDIRTQTTTAVEQPAESSVVASPGPADAQVWQLPTNWETPRPEVPTPEPSIDPEDADPPSPQRRPVLTAIVGVVAILGLVAGIYTLANGGDDAGTMSSGATTTTPAVAATATTMAGAASTQPAVPTTVAAPQPDPGVVQPVSSGDADLAGIDSCTRVDATTLEISMVNTSDVTSTYLLTVVYLDVAGARVGDDKLAISSIRPGERSLEHTAVYSDAGVGCEIVGADRYAHADVEALPDLSACTIRQPAVNGLVEADVAATNPGAGAVDYTVEIALVDAQNVRRGYGTAFIEQAIAGTATPGVVYTSVAYDPSYRCDVVAVTRYPSAQ